MENHPPANGAWGINLEQELVLTLNHFQTIIGPIEDMQSQQSERNLRKVG